MEVSAAETGGVPAAPISMYDTVLLCLQTSTVVLGFENCHVLPLLSLGMPVQIRAVLIGQHGHVSC